MQTKDFERTLFAIAIVLSAIITVVSFVVLTQGPRVRGLQFEDGFRSSNLTRGKSLTVRFDRPIEQNDYSDAVTLEPMIGYSVRTEAQGLVLTFDENLTSGQDYILKIDPKIVDNTGRMMSKSYRTSFDTPTHRYAYLARQYGLDPVTLDQKNDIIFAADVHGEPIQVFSAPVIRSFVVNADYYVVVVSRSDGDSIQVVDRHSLKAMEIQNYKDSYITNLAIAPHSNRVLFTVEPEFNSVDSDQFARVQNRLFSIDITGLDNQAITDENNSILQVQSIHMFEDGQLAIVGDQQARYYAVSPYNDYAPILLGSHNQIYGLNPRQPEVIFRTRQAIAVYDLLSSKLVDRLTDEIGIVQDIDYSTNKLVITQSDNAAENLLTSVWLSDSWESSVQEIWKEPGQAMLSIKDVYPSFDSTYLAVETNPDSCEFDSIGVGGNCKNPKTLIISVNSKDTVAEIDGFSLRWLP